MRRFWLVPLCSLAIGLSVSAAGAAGETHIAASGTIRTTSESFTVRRVTPGLTVASINVTSVLTGTFSGSTVETGTCMIDASGGASCTLTEIFTGTVAGRSGTVTCLEVATVAGDSFAGEFIVTDATGGLTGLRGTGRFTGAGEFGTYTGSFTLP